MQGISRQQRFVLGISIIVLSVALPAAFGLDLVTSTQDQEQVVEAIPTPEVPVLSPEATAEVAPEPTVSPAVEEVAPTPKASAGPTSPAMPDPTPIPIHALANQSIYIITPNIISVDPRARSVVLPSIVADSSEILLLCATSNKALLNISDIPYIPVAINLKKPELGSRNVFQISGQGSTQLRISGPSYAVMSAFNGGNGMRITSTSGSISGSQINLQFVNMSEPTLADHFCSSGVMSNNRSISVRALNIDLHMVKTDVNLKKNR
jgi:hypothetical protein